MVGNLFGVVVTAKGAALLVGTILGQFSMGFVVDRVGRKAAMTITTLFIVLGGILGTVAHAPSAVGFFWFITVARGMVGYGAGGEYPAASTAVGHSCVGLVTPIDLIVH